MGVSPSETSYDSTWEEDEDDSSVETQRSTASSKEAIYPKAQESPRKLEEKHRIKYSYQYMYSVAALDMHSYRHQYQPSGSNYQSSPDEMPNLMFYRNQMKFKPNGLYIDELLRHWKDQYDILEENHDYIQWLFPLRERGKNPHSTPLHDDEIKIMKNDEDVKRKLCEAYKLILGFYGLQLSDDTSGTIMKAKNWQERYRNLDSNRHNNLRITRILKCLGELGYEHFQVSLVHFFLEETLRHGNLQNVKRSVLDYFMFSVRDKEERKRLVRIAWEYYEPKARFIWGPVEVLQNNSEYLSKNVVVSREERGSSPCCMWFKNKL